MIFNEDEMKSVCKELGIEVTDSYNYPILNGKEILAEDIKDIFNNVEE